MFEVFGPLQEDKTPVYIVEECMNQFMGSLGAESKAPTNNESFDVFVQKLHLQCVLSAGL